jgi:hypothetical protein
LRLDSRSSATSSTNSNLQPAPSVKRLNTSLACRPWRSIHQTSSRPSEEDLRKCTIRLQFLPVSELQAPPLFKNLSTSVVARYELSMRLVQLSFLALSPSALTFATGRLDDLQRTQEQKLKCRSQQLVPLDHFFPLSILALCSLAITQRSSWR